MKKQISIILSVLLLGTTLQAQITRGEGEGELFISTDWYMDSYGHVHYAIFHSTDNGEHITLKYENIETPPPEEMQVGKVLGDATPGALYNYGNNELWVSFDYGGSWEFVENYGGSGFYTSGSFQGEIYKNGTDVTGTLYYSDDFGYIFSINNIDIKFYIEVGTELGELYGKSGFAGIGYNLKHSSDYGQSFDMIPIDSTVAFWSIGGYQPRISRGTESGEIYLVSWWLDSNYKIFHSSDTGYTWTEKFESETIDIYYWRVAYTAGKEPGSFYVLRSRINPAGDHVWLYIDYSSDYGETFTTYFHDLDSNITSVNPAIMDNIKLSNYPNPFNKKTTIKFHLPKNCKKPMLNIYNAYGKLLKQYDITGKKIQQWDGKDHKGNNVSKGVYLYNINYGEYVSPIKKMLYL